MQHPPPDFDLVSGKLAACDQNSNQTLREVLAVAGGDVSLVAPNSEP